MRKYAELGTVYRSEPCAEYPGLWLVGEDGMDEPWVGHATRDAAWRDARARERRASVYWACSEDDPRVGQVWFTGFYLDG